MIMQSQQDSESPQSPQSLTQSLTQAPEYFNYSLNIMVHDRTRGISWEQEFPAMPMPGNFLESSFSTVILRVDSVLWMPKQITVRSIWCSPLTMTGRKIDALIFVDSVHSPL